MSGRELSSQDYISAYDESKILRKNCIPTVSEAKGAFISAGSSGYVERLEDDSVLNHPALEKRAPAKLRRRHELLERTIGWYQYWDIPPRSKTGIYGKWKYQRMSQEA